ncbi:thermonuclease family protein, partial [Candidatus Uhrbacteria bacterium]|nr:thermonuclease family protein [Candidatus Uhrbacteria bacterium]
LTLGVCNPSWDQIKITNYSQVEAATINQQVSAKKNVLKKKKVKKTTKKPIKIVHQKTKPPQTKMPEPTKVETPSPSSEVRAGQIQGNASMPVSNEAVEFFTVTRVVDGDTFDVRMNGKSERIRAIGVDTPESVDPRKPVQCFSKEASNKTSELLLNKKVYLESDPTQGERDKYNRLLRYAYREDGLFFNKSIIELGFAHEYTYVIPYKFQSEFKAAQTAAREKQFGLWAPEACAPPNLNATSTPSEIEGNALISQSKDGHTWYTSSHHTARFYYCDTDPQWRGLSQKYLQTFTSKTVLLNKYQRTLHETCK